MEACGEFAMRQISCERCAQTPGLSLHLGCGEPPSESHPYIEVGSRYEESLGRVVTPHEAHAAGLPPYPRELWGLGEIRRDWPWCPRWYSAFNEASDVGPGPLDASLSEALYFVESGSAAQAYPGAFTACMIDGLTLYRACKAEGDLIQAKRAPRKGRG